MLATSLAAASQNDLADSRLARAVAWLRATDLSALPDGRHDIGDGLFANVMTLTTAAPEAKDFEAHHAYHDIHFVIEGTDLIGVAPVDACAETKPYDDADDYALYTCPDPARVSWVTLRPGELCLTPPADAHKPGCTLGSPARLRKAVVKVPVAAERADAAPSGAETIGTPGFRGLRRFKQALSAEDCEAILLEAPRGVLSVIGDGGYPYGVPMNFVYRDGKVYFHSAREGHKIEALAACSQACFTVLDQGVQEPGDWWYHFRSVVVFGQVRVMGEGPERDEALVALGRKYFPSEDDVRADVAKNGGRAAVLELAVDHLSGKAVREK